MGNTGLSLLGFMDETDAIAYLRQVCTLTLDQERPEWLANFWRSASQKLGNPIPRAGNPLIKGLPREHEAYMEQVQRHPRWTNPIDNMPVEDFVLVEIDRLIAYQPHIWLERAAERAVDMSTSAPLEKVLELCLPISFDPVQGLQKVQGYGSGEVTIVVPDTDLTIKPLDEHILGGQADKSAMMLGWLVERKLPYTQVAFFNDRYYLRNGFHRLYGLRAKGIEYAPCILVNALTPEQVGIDPARGFKQSTLESNSPPTVAHYTQRRAVEIPLQIYRQVIYTRVVTEKHP